MMLTSLSDCAQFISTHGAKAIAQQLHRDQETCRAGGLPTLLSFALKGASSTLADEIGFHLLEHNGSTKVPISIVRLHYKNILRSFRRLFINRVYWKTIDKLNR